MKKPTLLLLLSCMVIPNVAALGQTEASPERPNIIVLLCDDLGYGDLSCYGHPVIETPHLDRLAGDGIRLTDCYSAAPVCSPSRVGLLTGRSPNRAGVYDWIPPARGAAVNLRDEVHLRRGEMTLPLLLGASGYQTCLVGKWHCNSRFNSAVQPQPDAAGFDHWFATQNNASPSHKNPRNFVRNGKPVGPLEGYSAGLIVEEAIRWLGATESNRPFYLQVCFHEPHEPVASPPELVKKYLAKSRNEDEAHYFANVENVDRAVGRLTTYLAKEGLTSNTLICFTSDNGPETLNRYRNANRSYGSPGALKGMKLWTSEAGFRVPGILHWPAVVQPGLISARIVSALDFLPTFCALAGSPLPKRTLDGTDISGLLRGQGFVRTKPLLWCYYNAINERRVALRSGDWKILAALHHQGNPLPKLTNVHGGNRETVAAAQLADFELYHLADSSEATEVTAVFPERLAAMKKELEHHYRALSQDSHIWNR